MIKDLPLKVNHGVHAKGRGQKLDLILTALVEEEERFRSAILDIRGHTRGNHQVELTLGKIVMIEESLYVKVRNNGCGAQLSCHYDGYTLSSSKEYPVKD